MATVAASPEMLDTATQQKMKKKNWPEFKALDHVFHREG